MNNAEAAVTFGPGPTSGLYLYIEPERITPSEANEKARPAEKPDDRRKRVELMAASIAAVGQKYPVLVQATDGEGSYEYIDGGCRVEAVALLNERHGVSSDPPWTVWCSLVDPAVDTFRTAVVSNLHRTQNSVLDMAMICQEARERNGWKGRGAGKQVAAYLGILPSRVSEYEKVLHLPTAVKARIESGEITALDAVLKLMNVKGGDEAIDRTAGRAVEIAQEEAERAQVETHNATPLAGAGEAGDGGSGNETAPRKGKKGAGKTAKAKLIKSAAVTNKPKVKARHITQAARETGAKVARSKVDMIFMLAKFNAEPYKDPTRDFIGYFLDTWVEGGGSDKKLVEKFDAMVGMKPETKEKWAAKMKAAAAAEKGK